VFAFTFAVSISAGIIFGLAPAWRLWARSVTEPLSEGSRGGTETTRSNRVRSALVVTQVALALVLLTGGSLLVESLKRIGEVNPGFRADHLLTLEAYRSIPKDVKHLDFSVWSAFYQEVFRRIQALPGVESVGATSALPVEGSAWVSNFSVPGQTYSNNSERPYADYRVVSNNYFQMMDIPLLKGRYFTESDTKASRPVAIINETLARRYYPGQDPVGKQIMIDAFSRGLPSGRVIVGVVRDVKQSDLSVPSNAEMYEPLLQKPFPLMTLAVRTKGKPTDVAVEIRKAIHSVDPNQPVAHVISMDQIVDRSEGQPRFRAVVLSLFAVLALIMAAVGIYGVIAYSVTRRTHEIGVRMALGAQKSDVLKLVVWQGMVLAVVGVGIGIIAALGLTRLISSLLYDVKPTDAATFIFVSLVLTGMALLACCIPARRAARVDPMVALRYE
jgi:putative ABC transport system permease protein